MGAVRYGWIGGYNDGTFRPDNLVTRAEVAVIVNRMLNRSADEVYVNDHRDGLVSFTDVGMGYWACYDIMEAANTHTYQRDDLHEVWLQHEVGV